MAAPIWRYELTQSLTSLKRSFQFFLSEVIISKSSLTYCKKMTITINK